MEQMKSTSFILICIFLALAKLAAAKDICPGSDKLPAPSGAQELKMYEKDFSVDRAMESVNFLEKDVIKIISENEHKSYSILDYEGFYIGYPNNITFVKGALLKQVALLANEKFEIEQLKLKNGTTTKEEVKKTEKAYREAQRKFCDFLKQAEYVD